MLENVLTLIAEKENVVIQPESVGSMVNEGIRKLLFSKWVINDNAVLLLNEASTKCTVNISF